MVQANPGLLPLPPEFVAPPWGVELPIISFSSPLNSTVFATDTITLSFRVTTNTSKNALSNDSSYAVQGLARVSYELDWQKDYVPVYVGYEPVFVNKTVVCKATLNEIPDGRHSINVSAVAYGQVTKINSHYTLDYYSFYVNASSLVYFTVDKTSPNIVVQLPLSGSYDGTDVPLHFTVNEQVAWMRYSLDGQENVTITKNITLPALSVGSHTIRVYANDTAGNIASSGTISFVTKEPFPSFSAAAAVVVAAVVVAVAVVVGVKKRKTSGAGIVKNPSKIAFTSGFDKNLLTDDVIIIITIVMGTKL
jgi:hypothetical protein